MSIISKDSVILKQARNIKAINLDKLQREAIEDKDKKLVQNQRDQLRDGRMGNGLLPEYSPKSQTLKDRSNYKAKWPTMDLYDTGSFQDKMNLEILSKSVFLDSTDNKTNDLLKRFSEQIFEPDQKTKRINQEDVTPTYNKLVHKALNK